MEYGQEQPWEYCLLESKILAFKNYSCLSLCLLSQEEAPAASDLLTRSNRPAILTLVFLVLSFYVPEIPVQY